MLYQKHCSVLALAVITVSIAQPIQADNNSRSNTFYAGCAAIGACVLAGATYTYCAYRNQSRLRTNLEDYKKGLLASAHKEHQIQQRDAKSGLCAKPNWDQIQRDQIGRNMKRDHVQEWKKECEQPFPVFLVRTFWKDLTSRFGSNTEK